MPGAETLGGGSPEFRAFPDQAPVSPGYDPSEDDGEPIDLLGPKSLETEAKIAANEADAAREELARLYSAMNSPSGTRLLGGRKDQRIQHLQGVINHANTLNAKLQAEQTEDTPVEPEVIDVKKARQGEEHNGG